jgi:hypothetical protein
MNLLLYLILLLENYKKEMISRYGADRKNHPSFDGAAWCVAIGGVTKGRIYCAPSMPKSMVSTSASSQSYTMESTPPSSSIQALKEQIKERDGHILSLQQEMTSVVTHFWVQKKLRKYKKKKIGARKGC